MKENELGKLPPQALDLEEAVLGAFMLEKEAISIASGIVPPNAFYKDANKKIYEAILELHQKSEPIDILTVTQKLRANGTLEEVGGAYYISKLTGRVASAANVEHHCRIILQAYNRREIIRKCTDMFNAAYDETVDIFDLNDSFLQAAFNLTSISENKTEANNKEILKELTKKIELANKELGITGLKTPFKEQDKVFGGWNEGNLIINAARPGMGKTSKAICEALYIAFTTNKKVVFYSLEMTALELMRKIVAIITDIPLGKLKEGNLNKYDWVKYQDAREVINSNLIIFDNINTLNGIISSSKKMALKNSISAVYVDYLQLVEIPSFKGSREQEVSQISRSLKGLAKSLNIPLVALCQLSRAVETRGGDKIPQLSDLRESGSIEQDADIVQFIYRPEYYKIETDEEGNTTKGVAYFITAKNRHGALKDIKVEFQAELAKFKDFKTDLVESGSISPNENFDESPF